MSRKSKIADGLREIGVLLIAFAPLDKFLSRGVPPTGWEAWAWVGFLALGVVSFIGGLALDDS